MVEKSGSRAFVFFKQLREVAGIGRVRDGGESREVGMQKQGLAKQEEARVLTSGSNCCFLLPTFLDPSCDGGAWWRLDTFPWNGSCLLSLVLDLPGVDAG